MSKTFTGKQVPWAIPLPSLDRLEDYRFPALGDLVCTREIREGLAKVDRGEMEGAQQRRRHVFPPSGHCK